MRLGGRRPGTGNCGDYGRLAARLEEVAAANGAQVNTLKNYTRFPIGAVQSRLVDWACTETSRDVYGRPVVFLRLTEHGKSVVTAADELIDVREAQLRRFSLEERAGFAVIGFYAMLDRCGFDIGGGRRSADCGGSSGRQCPVSVLIRRGTGFSHSPTQQSDNDVLALASS